jgi:hypothetical protein
MVICRFPLHSLYTCVQMPSQTNIRAQPNEFTLTWLLLGRWHRVTFEEVWTLTYLLLGREPQFCPQQWVKECTVVSKTSVSSESKQKQKDNPLFHIPSPICGSGTEFRSLALVPPVLPGGEQWWPGAKESFPRSSWGHQGSSHGWNWWAPQCFPNRHLRKKAGSHHTTFRQTVRPQQACRNRILGNSRVPLGDSNPASAIT